MASGGKERERVDHADRVLVWSEHSSPVSVRDLKVVKVNITQQIHFLSDTAANTRLIVPPSLFHIC